MWWQNKFWELRSPSWWGGKECRSSLGLRWEADQPWEGQNRGVDLVRIGVYYYVPIPRIVTHFSFPFSHLSWIQYLDSRGWSWRSLHCRRRSKQSGDLIWRSQGWLVWRFLHCAGTWSVNWIESFAPLSFSVSTFIFNWAAPFFQVTTRYPSSSTMSISQILHSLFRLLLPRMLPADSLLPVFRWAQGRHLMCFRGVCVCVVCLGGMCYASNSNFLFKPL